MSAIHASRMTLIAPDAPLYAYLLRQHPPEHAVLLALREATSGMPRSFMQIAPDQGHFMAFLLRLLGARHVLELGTFMGYSALAMALALPADGKIVTCDVNGEWVDVGRPYWKAAGVDGKIEARTGPALETLARMESAGAGGTFDAAFVDADKENYGRYYEAAIRLVRRGGMVILDNMLHHGRVLDPHDREPGTVAIRELNDRIAADERVDRVMLPIGDGVTLVRRR